MKNDSENKGKLNLRGEPRTESWKNASVEFTPGNNPIAYHFKLRDFSSKGFGIIVRKDSKVLKFIKTGDVLTMKYHPDKASANPVSHKTQIKHISEHEPENNQDHVFVGLLILE